jgi:tetratricopeptide (TPR) repeat protein
VPVSLSLFGTFLDRTSNVDSSCLLKTPQKFFQSGSYPESILKYTAAIELHPTSALLFTNRSLAHFKVQNVSEAVADAREAVKLDDKAGKGWVRLGDGLILQGGDKKEAEAACESIPWFGREISHC